jgi:hypothetical protein
MYGVLLLTFPSTAPSKWKGELIIVDNFFLVPVDDLAHLYLGLATLAQRILFLSPYFSPSLVLCI